MYWNASSSECNGIRISCRSCHFYPIGLFKSILTKPSTSQHQVTLCALILIHLELAKKKSIYYLLPHLSRNQNPTRAPPQLKYRGIVIAWTTIVSCCACWTHTHTRWPLRLVIAVADWGMDLSGMGVWMTRSRVQRVHQGRRVLPRAVDYLSSG